MYIWDDDGSGDLDAELMADLPGLEGKVLYRGLQDWQVTTAVDMESSLTRGVFCAGRCCGQQLFLEFEGFVGEENLMKALKILKSLERRASGSSEVMPASSPSSL